MSKLLKVDVSVISTTASMCCAAAAALPNSGVCGQVDLREDTSLSPQTSNSYERLDI